MSRQKLPRFAQNEEAPNVIQQGKPLYETVKGQWNGAVFAQAQPLVLELACGRGEYTVGLSQAYKDKNFIGIDIKGARIWVGSQYALKTGLDNVAFLRTHIQNLDVFFAPEEVSEIWITFPDPRPKQRHAKRRLTHPRFLHMYQQMLKTGGWLHLKTDNTGLFHYTLDVLKHLGVTELVSTEDLYASPYAEDHLGIKTKFEAMFTALGQRIKYLRCVLPSHLTEKDFERVADLMASVPEEYDFAPTDAARALHAADAEDGQGD